MNRLAAILAAAALAVLAIAPQAHAAFAVTDFDVTFADSEGKTVTQAGSHPFAMTTSFEVATEPTGKGGVRLAGAVKDLIATQVEGFVGNPTPVPPCATADFLTTITAPGGFNVPDCPDSSAVGTVKVEALSNEEATGKGIYSAVYDLISPPGRAAKLGFWNGGVPVTIELGVEEAFPNSITGGPSNVSQIIEVYGAELTLWGVPADPEHDPERGICLDATGESLGECEAGISQKPFLTMPRACEGPLATRWKADSWPNPGAFIEDSVLTHDEVGNPVGMSGCGKLDFAPQISAQPTAKATASPSGLDFALQVKDEGLTNPTGIAAADIERAEVTLPAGMSANPALAEGLEVCTEAQLAEESASFAPGEGCPAAAKVGTVEVQTPLLEEKTLKGALFVAEPYRNPFDSLLALYIVIREPQLGILVRQPLRVQPDPQTGRLTTIAENLPPYPFSRFALHLREGSRSPLVTPPGCGGFQVGAKLYPSSGATPVDVSSTFTLISGPNGSACPSGAAPFKPGFEAGTLNNQAGSYSPFTMRITRNDGEQDLTRFSSVLPPGVLGKIAGIPYCPEAGIARAKSRTGQNGGTEERSDPSCPAASKIGTTLAGAGVGSQVVHVPGSLYLAGPYAGDPLSVVAITPAVAGPFDAGTVVVREALTLNPVTAQVEADGAASDPIPHILQGIPLNIRDLRVYVDRQDFTLNATSCTEEQARATLFGGGTVLAPSADAPAALASRYQAADCAALGFKPKLEIELRGGHKRGGHPALRAIVTPRPGDANFSRAVVILPRSAFLDQAHIRTICTRVQFAAGAGNGAGCPAGAVYGEAEASSPLLDEPLKGPVFLRSSSHNLPDLVVALHGLVDVELSSRIDSIRGGIRSTFTGIPDAPVSKFVLRMQGGQQGLIVNSRNLCSKPGRNKAKAALTGQNGRSSNAKPVVRAAKCKGQRKKKR